MSMMFLSRISGGTVMPLLDVAVALAEHLQVDGEHQRAAFGLRRARQECPWKSRGRG